MARRKSYLGQAASGDVSPVWGVAASGTVGTGTAIAIRTLTDMDKNAELIGMGAGVAAGAAMMLSERTRAAGFTGIITAVVTNGLRYAEALTSPKQQIKDIAGSLATLTKKGGNPYANQLKTAQMNAKAAGLKGGFGVVQANNMPLAGNLGLVSPEVIRSLSGGLGAASAEPMPALGAVSAEPMPLAGSQMPTFQGGGLGNSMPTFQGGIGGLGAHYGATGIGGGIN